VNVPDAVSVLMTIQSTGATGTFPEIAGHTPTAYRGVSVSGYAGEVFGLNNALLSLLSLAIVVLQGWALVDCVLRPTKAFEAAGKLTKPAWLAITAIALVVGLLFGPLGILGLAGIVASIVYLVDVRPAVRQVQGGGDRW
jgi:hypothetical protein